MAYQAQPIAPFMKGIVASNQPLAQPKGAVARASNLLMLERGALTPCDGSAIINQWQGSIQTQFGRFMATSLFSPTGITPYYLVLAQNTFLPLLRPFPVSATAVAGGSLTAGTYFYVITALDGVGGETLGSDELSATTSGSDLSITLVWNTVPNSYGYNIYRGIVTGGELLMVGLNVPVLQPSPLTATISFTDTGADSTSVTYAIATWRRSAPTIIPTDVIYTFTTVTANSIQINQSFVVTGTGIDGTYFANYISGNTIIDQGLTPSPGGLSGTGGSLVAGNYPPPTSDTTRQTVLFKMPAGTIPVSYSPTNIVATFPAAPSSLGVAPSGSTGGALGTQASTPSGGISGLVSMIPQFRQFTNRMVIALGNGYSPQLYWDSGGTLINPAQTGGVTSVSVSGDQVTITSGDTFVPSGATTNVPVGSNVILSGMSDATYDGNFVVLATGTHTLTVRNNLASGFASTGTYTISTTPLWSVFIPAYPEWTTKTEYPTGSIIVPATQPSAADVYLQALQGGTTGTDEPTWPTVLATGQTFPVGNIADGGVIWEEVGYLNSAAPPPPGAGHIEIYANSLWIWNTSPNNSGNGLDGPCALRMSGQGNPNNWNPVNQAFLDKDDGFEGQGLAKFTITALGIPPEGSLVAFKNRTPYQIIGVFGASNFAIQAVSSDMGCIAPRSIVFVPGFGIGRYTHMGFAIFDGVRDTLISEQIRPYLFATNDLDASDIITTDPSFIPISWGALTSNPPMYCVACPIGTNSLGQLTRIFCYDLVLKAWAIVDLPFAISCMAQVQPSTSTPITLLGGYLDGCLQRWQSGDVQWYTGGFLAQNVSWSFRTLTIASQNSDQRIYLRRLALRGTNSGAAGTISVQTNRDRYPQLLVNYPIKATRDFDIFSDIGLTGLRFDSIISGSVHTEIDGATWHLEPRPIGSIAGVI
jgi:hypothetical protein